MEVKKILLGLIFCLVLSACSMSGTNTDKYYSIHFESKFKQEYSEKVTSQEAEAIIDYVQLIEFFHKSSFTDVDSNEYIGKVYNQSVKLNQYFEKRFNGEVGNKEFQKDMMDWTSAIKILTYDLNAYKDGFKRALRDKEMGVKTENEKYLDIEDRSEEIMRQFIENVEKFKKYVE